MLILPLLHTSLFSVYPNQKLLVLVDIYPIKFFSLLSLPFFHRYSVIRCHLFPTLSFLFLLHFFFLSLQTLVLLLDSGFIHTFLFLFIIPKRIHIHMHSICISSNLFMLYSISSPITMS